MSIETRRWGHHAVVSTRNGRSRIQCRCGKWQSKWVPVNDSQALIEQYNKHTGLQESAKHRRG